MNKIYSKIESISGSVITVRAEGIKYNELAEIETAFGTSLAEVNRIDGDLVSLQVFAGGRGVSTGDKIRFLGREMEVCFSENLMGRIFNGSSDAWVGLPDNDAYSAANAGIVGLTYAASKELYRFGITVNAYCPQGASPSHAVEYNKMLRNVKAITGQDPDPRLLKVVEDDHGDPINLGSFFAFLSTEAGGYISGEVFGVKSSGKIDRYLYPQTVARIQCEQGTGFCWDVSELETVFREQLMGEGYVSHAAKRAWG